jgi:hypothetical protein
MSILNRPSDGLPSVLLALHRAIVAYGPMSEARLLALSAPLTVVQDGKPDMAKKTLFRWKQLGFFKESGRGISLTPQARLDPETDLDRLRKVVLNLLLAPENNPGLEGPGDGAERAEGEGSLAEDFTRAAAWVLCQDTYSFGAKWPAVEELLSNQRVAPKAIVNDVRWHGFVEWATFLGLGWASSGANINLDPAASVEWTLDDVFGKQQELKQDHFLQRLAEELPVVDGGRYRKIVEGTIGKPWRSSAPNEVSPSLSTALTHLEARSAIRLEPRADAAAASLVGRDGRVTRRFSHVLLGRAS